MPKFRRKNSTAAAAPSPSATRSEPPARASSSARSINFEKPAATAPSSPYASAAARAPRFGSNATDAMKQLQLQIQDSLATLTFDREDSAANLFDRAALV